MSVYPAAVRERAMKVEEVILRVLSKQLTFWQAAQILHKTPRHLRRVLQRYQHYGFEGLCDRRQSRPSPKRMPWAVAEQILLLYREKYFDFSVRHFHLKSFRIRTCKKGWGRLQIVNQLRSCSETPVYAACPEQGRERRRVYSPRAQGFNSSLCPLCSFSVNSVLIRLYPRRSRPC